DPLNANGSIVNVLGSINVGPTHLITITTSNDGDTINVKAKGITAQQLVVHGSGNNSDRVDAIRTGENATPPPPPPTKALRPAFVPKIVSNVNVSDQVTMDYTDLPVDNGNTVVKYSLAPGVLSVDAGVTLVTPVAFDGIEQLSIKANPGAVDV